MTPERRLEQLEEAAYRQGYDALTRRMDARLRTMSDAEIAALESLLLLHMKTGQASQELLAAIEELTQP